MSLPTSNDDKSSPSSSNSGNNSSDSDSVSSRLLRRVMTELHGAVPSLPSVLFTIIAQYCGAATIHCIVAQGMQYRHDSEWVIQSLSTDHITATPMPSSSSSSLSHGGSSHKKSSKSKSSSWCVEMPAQVDWNSTIALHANKAVASEWAATKAGTWSPPTNTDQDNKDNDPVYGDKATSGALSSSLPPSPPVWSYDIIWQASQLRATCSSTRAIYPLYIARDHMVSNTRQHISNTITGFPCVRTCPSLCMVHAGYDNSCISFKVVVSQWAIIIRITYQRVY